MYLPQNSWEKTNGNLIRKGENKQTVIVFSSFEEDNGSLEVTVIQTCWTNISNYPKVNSNMTPSPPPYHLAQITLKKSKLNWLGILDVKFPYPKAPPFGVSPCVGSTPQWLDPVSSHLLTSMGPRGRTAVRRTAVTAVLMSVGMSSSA